MIKFKMMIMLYRHVALCIISAQGKAHHSSCSLCYILKPSLSFMGLCKSFAATLRQGTQQIKTNVGGGQKHPHLLKNKKTQKMEYIRSVQAVQITVSCGSQTSLCSRTAVNLLFYQAEHIWPLSTKSRVQQLSSTLNVISRLELWSSNPSHTLYSVSALCCRNVDPQRKHGWNQTCITLP